ncbi:hypothetical protein NDN08_005075 [Rhodosorus marinus]|uniref:Uncharacterized protein n=1 Tax=Rhodosorus marinus TaxID=101924 RepID=A0AAV8V1I9_9RHOD|nr:hypothetical protein NDN08_005075 [Rhodosorus marinus]
MSGLGGSSDSGVDTRELNFLILHSLLNGPCEKSARELMREMQEKKLLPSQYDWNGDTSYPSYSQLSRKFSRLPPDYLRSLLNEVLTQDQLRSNSLLNIGNAPNSEELRRRKLIERRKRPRSCLQLLRQRAERGKRMPISMWSPEDLYKNFRKLKTLRGHSAPVYSVSFDRESRFIVTGSDDHLLKVWSADTAYLRHSLRGHEKDITALAFHPENTMIVSASNDGTLRAWDLRSGAEIAVLKGHRKAVLCVAFSPCPDRPYVLSGAGDGTCRLWNSDDFSIGSVTIEFPPKRFKRSRGRHHPPDDFAHAESHATPGFESNTLGSHVQGANSTVSGSQLISIEILSVNFNPGGTRFVVGGTDCTAYVCQVLPRSPPRKPEVKHLATLRGHSGFPYKVSFSHLGDKICTGSSDGTARVWSRARCPDGPSSRTPRSKKVTSTWASIVLNVRVATTLSNNSVPEPPAGTSSTVGRIRRHFGNPEVTAVVWTIDDKRLVTSCSDNLIRVWDANNGQLIHSLDFHKNQVFVLDSHPLDKRILLSGSYDGKCVLWDIEKGTTLHVFDPPDDSSEDVVGKRMVVDGRWAPNGLIFAISDDKGCMSMYSIGDGEQTKQAPEQQFFMKDYAGLAHDQRGNTLDEQLRVPPHRIPQGPLCDAYMIPHPPSQQPIRFVKPGSYNFSSSPRSASTMRAELIARAEAFRRREVEEEKRLAREAYFYGRERTPAEALLRARREREELESGSYSAPRSTLSRPEDGDLSMAALDTFENPEDSHSEPENDAEWSLRDINRSNAAGAMTSENQQVVSEGDTALRSERREGEDSQTRSLAAQDSVTANEMETPSPLVQSNPHGAVELRSRRFRQYVHDGTALRNAEMDSASAFRRSKSLEDARTEVQDSFAMEGTRVEQMSSIAFLREDQRSVAATESIGQSHEQGSIAASESVGKSEAAEARRGHIVQGSGVVYDQHSRRTFSSRSGSESPTSAKLEDGRGSGIPRKRQRRTQEGANSPSGTRMVERNEPKNVGTITKRNRRRSERANRSNAGVGRVSLGLEIGSGKLKPTQYIERKRDVVPERFLLETIPLSASEWLLCTDANEGEYVPQVGDRVVYFPQGHQSLVEAEIENGIWNPDAANTSIPKSRDGEPSVFEVIRIEYKITQCIFTVDREKKQSLWDDVRNVARLFLKRVDGKEDSELYLLNYYPVDSVPEYVVLESRVSSSKSKTWKIGEKFRMLFMDEKRTGVFYTGRIVNLSPDMESRPWNSIEVQWESENDPDRGARMFVSPWELEPIDGGEQPSPVSENGRRVRHLSNRIVSAVTHQLEANEAFRVLASPLIVPVQELAKKVGYTNLIPCPLTLSTWLGRLKNHFYRQESAIVEDLNLLRANTVAYSPYDGESAARMTETSKWLVQAVNKCRAEGRQQKRTLDTKSTEGAGGYNACTSANNEGQIQALPHGSPSVNHETDSTMPPPTDVRATLHHENSVISGAAAESTISYGGTKTVGGATESVKRRLQMKLISMFAFENKEPHPDLASREEVPPEAVSD